MGILEEFDDILKRMGEEKKNNLIHELEFQKSSKLYQKYPQDVKKRIFLEYYLFLYFITKKKLNVNAALKKLKLESGYRALEINNIKNELAYVSSNGCIFAKILEENITEETVIEIKFNCFSQANPTFKSGKITTDEVFQQLSLEEIEKNFEEKIYCLVVLLNNYCQSFE